MIKKYILIVFGLVILTLFQTGNASCDEYYRTFEIIGKSENSLTLQDSDGNVIEVNEDPDGFRVGYLVRYDSIRKRLRDYRWQDYEVVSITDDAITLRHKRGDILSIAGNFTREFKVGDEVRYDSVGNKLLLNEEAGQWKQFVIVESDQDKIKLRSNDGKEIILSLDNNIYESPRGLFIARYKVGDQVRYNATTNKIRKGIIRTYDWQDYVVKEADNKQITLVSGTNEELVLENTFSGDFKAGEKVKYDRINNLLKKAR